MHTQNNPPSVKKKKSLSIQEMVVFAMLGTLMFCSKVLMEILPNIHLVGMLTMVFTLVFRKKALVPIYVFVLLNALHIGILSMWWLPYLYIWLPLWAVTMLLPRHIPKRIACIVYPVVCGLHGLTFGTLYAPAQALMVGLNFKQTVAWIIAGLPWDAVHGIGNFCAGMLIVPLSKLLKKITSNHQRMIS